MSPWGWRPERTQGIWRHGPLWFKPLVAVSSLATGVLCCMLMYVVGDSLTVARGILFDLPDASAADDVAASSVVLMMPLKNDTAVFFDDARYSIDSGTSTAVLREHLSERMDKVRQKSLLVLADRRVPHGDIAQFAAIARASGVERLLLANKHGEAHGE